jgi:hypothetical protein
MAAAKLIERDRDVPDLEREARKRVKELKGFYSHASIFAVINLFLIVLNLLTSPGEFWAIWPLLGWGVGLASHMVSVFGFFGFGGKDWEERKIREYVLQRQHGLGPAQVKQLLQEELRSSRPGGLVPGEWDRLVERIEHLEAIVTSEDWDRLQAEPPGLAPEPEALDEASEAETPAQRAERLARRIR